MDKQKMIIKNREHQAKNNYFETLNNYMKCTVKDGRSFLIDNEDVDKVKLYTWHIRADGYVLSGNGKNHRLRLHRYLLGVEKDDSCVVDHINGNPLDNRKSNLRITNQRNNTRNQILRRDSSTGYKGVSYTKRERKYRAYIFKNKQIGLGYYDNPIDAAKAYDKAAILMFGDYAKTNFDRRYYAK